MSVLIVLFLFFTNLYEDDVCSISSPLFLMLIDFVVMLKELEEQHAFQLRMQRGLMTFLRLITASRLNMMSSAWFSWRLHVFTSAATSYLTQYQMQQRLNAMLGILGQFRRGRMRAAWQCWTVAHQTAKLKQYVCTRWLASVTVTTVRQSNSRRLARAFTSWRNFVAACTAVETDRVRKLLFVWEALRNVPSHILLCLFPALICLNEQTRKHM